jgi:hypothetical protein
MDLRTVDSALTAIYEITQWGHESLPPLVHRLVERTIPLDVHAYIRLVNFLDPPGDPDPDRRWHRIPFIAALPQAQKAALFAANDHEDADNIEVERWQSFWLRYGLDPATRCWNGGSILADLVALLERPAKDVDEVKSPPAKTGSVVDPPVKEQTI